VFRYAVGVPRAGEDVEADVLALRTAYEVDRPLVGVVAHGTGERAAELSLLSVDDPRVTVLDAVPVAADDGTDILVRLQSYAPAATTVRLRCAVPVAAASLATLLGDPTGAAEVDGAEVVLPVPRLGSVAVRLRLADAAGGR
jgi:hypothetical protein